MFWVIHHHRPYGIIEDDELLEIFRMLNSKAEIPSARTLSCNIQEVFPTRQEEHVGYAKSESFIRVSASAC